VDCSDAGLQAAFASAQSVCNCNSLECADIVCTASSACRDFVRPYLQCDGHASVEYQTFINLFTSIALQCGTPIIVDPTVNCSSSVFMQAFSSGQDVCNCTGFDCLNVICHASAECKAFVEPYLTCDGHTDALIDQYLITMIKNVYSSCDASAAASSGTEAFNATLVCADAVIEASAANLQTVCGCSGLGCLSIVCDISGDCKNNVTYFLQCDGHSSDLIQNFINLFKTQIAQCSATGAHTSSGSKAASGTSSVNAGSTNNGAGLGTKTSSSGSFKPGKTTLGDTGDSAASAYAATANKIILAIVIVLSLIFIAN